jgi:glycosyltransferase involved in cell wall biosynthesis
MTDHRLAPGSRWLVLTQYYPPELGAPQVRLGAMTRELTRHGLDVRVLTAMPNYPTGVIADGYQNRWLVDETIDSVAVRRLWIFPAAGRGALRRLANYLSFSVTGLLGALAAQRPDVVFVEAQPLTLGLAALIVKWTRGVPYIYNGPDLQVEVAGQLGFVSHAPVLRLAAALERLVARQSWKVATVTNQFVEHFRREGVPTEQITFLPNGADADLLRPAPPSAALLDRWDLHGKKVFLYVGTHAYYHGLEVVIDAAARLRDRDDIAVLMIGRGPERAALLQRAAALGLNNVTFDDSPMSERRDLYSIAYASLVTLRDIPVAAQMRPAKLFPSLSCGVPVLCSAPGESADLVRDAMCGITVPPGDADALAAAIAVLASDAPRRDEMGRNGRALVERDYAWSVIVARWLNELRRDASAPEPSSTPAGVDRQPKEIS